MRGVLCGCLGVLAGSPPPAALNVAAPFKPILSLLLPWRQSQKHKFWPPRTQTSQVRAAPPPQPQEETLDAVVVGAGVSGLCV